MGSKWLARTGQTIFEWVGFLLVAYLLFWMMGQSSTPSSLDYRKRRRKGAHMAERRPRKMIKAPDRLLSRVPTKRILERAFSASSKMRKLSWKEIEVMVTQEDFVMGYTAAIGVILDIKYEEYLGRLRTLEKEGSHQGVVPGDRMQSIFRAGKESEKKRFAEILDRIIERQNMLTGDSVAFGLRRAFKDQTEGFPSVIGRDEMKDWLARHLHLVCSDPISASRRCLNMVFLGPSGVGKTRLAELVSFFFRQTGIFVFGDVIKASKKDFTSPYVDSGTHMTSDLLSKGLENVLFFDEGYSLGSGGQQGHSQGAIDEIVKQSEPNDGMSAFVLCGYAQMMAQGFFGMNEGLTRRFPHVFQLSQNGPDALTRIFFRFLEAKHPRLCSQLVGDDARKIYTLLLDACGMQPPMFPRQAGDMKTLASNFSENVYSVTGGSFAEIFALCLRDFSRPVGLV